MMILKQRQDVANQAHNLINKIEKALLPAGST